MGYSTAQTLLEDYFKDNWTDTPVVFENMSHIPNEPFVRFSVQFARPEMPAIGGRCFRYFGTVFIQIFVKANVGVASAMSLADTVSALFRAMTVSGMVFGVPSVSKVYPGEDDWMQARVSCGFYFDEQEGN